MPEIIPVTQFLQNGILKIDDCNKQLDIKQLAELNNLEEVHINNCNSITNINFILNSDYIKIISITNCENFADISVLQKKQFQFLNTVKFSNLPCITKDHSVHLFNQQLLSNLTIINTNFFDLKQINNLVNLKAITLENNLEMDVTCVFETKLPVETVIFRGNIYLTMDQDISNLDNIQVLYLSNNKIKGISSTKKLYNIQEIDLSYNLAVTINHQENFTSLKKLVVNHAALIYLSLIQDLKGLLYLDISNNCIMELSELYNFQQLKLLQTLIIYKNPITLLRNFRKQLADNIHENIKQIYIENPTNNDVGRILCFKIDIKELIQQYHKKIEQFNKMKDVCDDIMDRSRQVINGINAVVPRSKPHLSTLKLQQQVCNANAYRVKDHRKFVTDYKANYFQTKFARAREIQKKSVNAYFMFINNKQTITQKQKADLTKMCDMKSKCIYNVLTAQKYPDIENIFDKGLAQEVGTTNCKDKVGEKCQMECNQRAQVAVKVLQKLYDEGHFHAANEADASDYPASVRQSVIDGPESQQKQEGQKPNTISPFNQPSALTGYQKIQIPDINTSIKKTKTVELPDITNQKSISPFALPAPVETVQKTIPTKSEKKASVDSLFGEEFDEKLTIMQNQTQKPLDNASLIKQTNMFVHSTDEMNMINVGDQTELSPQTDDAKDDENDHEQKKGKQAKKGKKGKKGKKSILKENIVDNQVEEVQVKPDIQVEPEPEPVKEVEWNSDYSDEKCAFILK